MKKLKELHIKNFGEPIPVTVKVGAQEGPAIIVSGHDLKALEELLKQCEGTGVIFTLIQRCFQYMVIQN